MFDTCEQTPEFALIEAIAAALREELGIPIEDQPGFHDPSEAGQVNRAFRVIDPDDLHDDRPAGGRPAGTPEPGLSAGSHGDGLKPACSTPTRSITCSAWSWMAATTGSRS